MATTFGGGWRNPDYGFDAQGMAGGLAGLAGGLFGNPGKPYDKAMEQYREFMQKGEQVQNPYLQYGKQGLQDFYKWLQTMQNPSEFINNLMSQYQESPFAQYQQQQAQRAAMNAASASGLTGSTPLMQQMQENAQKISSGDMNTWLQNVLGINTQYGAGQSGQADRGQTAANALTQMYNDMAKNMADAAYGKEAGKQSGLSNIIGGIGSIVGSFL